MKFLIIAKKEILDITRDKRTLLMMIAFPLLLMPVLIGTMMKITTSQAEKASEKEIKIAFIGQQYAPNLFNAFSNSLQNKSVLKLTFFKTVLEYSNIALAIINFIYYITKF